MKQVCILAQSITISSHTLEVVDNLDYVVTLSLDAEKTSRRVWQLRVKSKPLVYQACVLSTLLYSREIWTIHASQEKRLKSYNFCSLRRTF